MRSIQMKAAVAVVAVCLSMSNVALACQRKAVVGVQYVVDEQLPERVEAAVTNPLERMMVGLPRLVEINSVTSDGIASFELAFEGGATDDDLALVETHVDAFDAERRRAVQGSEAGTVRVFLTSACMGKWPWRDVGPSGARSGW
jgi:hypothetical protein